MILLISNFGVLGSGEKTRSIPISDLTKGSQAIVKVQCDYCNDKTKDMEYKTFLSSIKENGKYASNDCKGEKVKELMRIHAERGEYTETDKGYYSSHANRLKMVNDY